MPDINMKITRRSTCKHTAKDKTEYQSSNNGSEATYYTYLNIYE